MLGKAEKKALALKVESDLPFVSGEESVEVGPSGGEYTLRLAPQLGGQYTGSITFTNPANEQFVWYTMEVEVDSPLQEQTIDLSATVRKVVSAPYHAGCCTIASGSAKVVEATSSAPYETDTVTVALLLL